MLGSMRGLCLSLVVVALGVTPAGDALAKKSKVQHKAVVAPTWAGEVDPGLGTITDLQAVDGTLFVAATRGIAALDGAGTVKWKTELPPSTVRNLTVGDGIVAWSGFSVAGVDETTGFHRFLLGSAGDAISFTGTGYGVVDAATGAATWAAESDEQSSISPPGISPVSIGIMRRGSFIALDRATGAELGRYDVKQLGMDGKLFGGIYDQAVRIQPAVTDDAFYTGLFSHLFKLDHQGNFIDKSWGNGLTAYVTITCGPIVLDDNVVFGSTGDSNIASAFFGVNAKMKGTFRTWIPDTNSGCSTAIVDGDTAIMATNFYVVELDRRGRILWESVNKKGGLYPSQMRGIRYARSFPVRKSYADLLAVDSSRIYVATDNGHDVITVLERDGGAYVQTIDVNQTISALAVVDGKLAVGAGTKVLLHPAP